MSEYVLVAAGVLLGSVAIAYWFSNRITNRELTPREQVKALLETKEARYDDLVQSVGSYYEKVPDLSHEDRKYQYNYHIEELLKLLISLDSIDLHIFPEPDKSELKTQRKQLIRSIQLKQKELDKFKTDGYKLAVN